MTKKIFFSDLDGTLLNNQKEITELTYKAVMEWMDNGNILTLSSGRPLDSIREVVELNKLMHENLYTIAFNGAVIYHPLTGKKLTSKTLSLEDMEIISRIASENNIYCHAYDDTHILTARESEELFFYKRTVHIPHTVVPDFPKGLTPSYKILCISIGGRDKLTELSKKLTNELDSITCVLSNDNLLEVFSSAAGKGVAVKELCDLLSVDIKDSLAAGDEQNDISMIKAAGIGIAMLNGRDSVKENADVITASDNNNDGLLPFFKNPDKA